MRQKFIYSSRLLPAYLIVKIEVVIYENRFLKKLRFTKARITDSKAIGIKPWILQKIPSFVKTTGAVILNRGGVVYFPAEKLQQGSWSELMKFKGFS
jgi:hypothetical protein